MSDTGFGQIIDAIFNNPDPTNKIAFYFILGLTLLALFGIYSERHKRLTQYAKNSPSILATVGIFFSFWGISIGLIEFDPNHMKESTPLLLDGLKVKFIASLMGIAASIIVRIAQSFKLKANDSENEDSEQVIIELLKEIKQSLSVNQNNNSEKLLSEFQKQSGLLEAIKTNLAGEGDASVTTQLIKIRTSINDGLENVDKHNTQYFREQNELLDKKFNHLTNKFDDFAQSVAENNSKSLIEALENVMRDFNTKINEQFGENFKELNRAVGALLVWQENYKIHIEQLTDNFTTALITVKKVNVAFCEIETRSQSFTNTSEKLHNILEGLDKQLNDLSNHLRAFDMLSDNAKNAFPLIEKNLENLTTSFKHSTEQSLNDINDTVENMSESLTESAIKFDSIVTKIKQTLDIQENILTGAGSDFKNTITEILSDLFEKSTSHINQHEKTLKQLINNQLDNINNSIYKSSDEFNRLLTENTTKSITVLERQTQLLDAALQEELKKAINYLGTNLTSLSKAFVNDYQPLTEKLRDVVRLAEDLKRGRN